MRGTVNILSSTSAQVMLNSVLDKFDILLAEVIRNLADIDQFRSLKSELRQLFNYLEKEILTLKNDFRDTKRSMEQRISDLESAEKDVNVIRIGNVAGQLRNKMIRFVLPDLSIRAARDENFEFLHEEPRFAELSELIRTRTPNLKTSIVVRAINALRKERVQKAHNEEPLSAEQLDIVLAEFVKSHDPYLAEQATVVVKYLKVFAETLNEPLIVDMG
jgi:hypothetical protein